MINATYAGTEIRTEEQERDVFVYAMAYALLTSQMPYAALTAVRKVFQTKGKHSEADNTRDICSLDLFEEIARKLPFLVIADNHRPEFPLVIKGKNLYQIIPGLRADNFVFADFVTSDRYLTSAVFDNLDMDSLPDGAIKHLVPKLKHWLTEGTRDRRIIAVLHDWLNRELSEEAIVALVAEYLTLSEEEVRVEIGNERSMQAALWVEGVSWEGNCTPLYAMMSVWLTLFRIDEVRRVSS